MLLSGLLTRDPNKTHAQDKRNTHAELTKDPHIQTENRTNLSLSFSPSLSPPPFRRLGGGPDDAKEIMRHSYFTAVDWQDVYDKKVAL